MTFRTLDDLKPAPGLKALVRVDFNVPMDGGHVSDETRLKAALPTIRDLTAAGAKVILIAHFDRPKGKRVPEMSLKPVAGPLAALLGAPVAFADDCVGHLAEEAVSGLCDGAVLLLENLRFHAEEEANDAGFSAALGKLADVYVNDAFSVSHRAHASTEGVTHHLPAYAGRSMQAELTALEAALGSPQRPVLGIVGGSKVSTKLDLLDNLVTKLDRLAIGGGMANTFLAAMGVDVGASLCEHDLCETARTILESAAKAGCEILLP
ncbi:MAG: phosphoglycerate kinase, partial [Caulobacteraceae bacterium]